MAAQTVSESTSPALQQVGLFATLPPDDLERLAGIVKRRVFDPGHQLFRRHDEGDGMYLIVSGRVRIWIRNDGETEVILDRPGPGDFFGELALLDGGSRSANATVDEATELYFLPREDFERFLVHHPPAALRMLGVLALRLRQSNVNVHRQVSDNANIRADQELTWADRLADSVTRFGGSWSFVLLFIGFGLVWTTINVILPSLGFAGDAYPFNLLNLFVSAFACIQAPFILITQRRQMRRNRIAADLDYQVNLSNELRLTEIHQKLDSVTAALQRAAG